MRERSFIETIVVVAVAFVAGAFIASPELRAYAANTVGSADIINNSIQSVDIKDGEVKTADIGQNAVTTAKIAFSGVTASDIGPDAVTANEIAGVSKLIFDKFTLPAGDTIPAGDVECYDKTVSGAQPGDLVLATSQNNAANGIVVYGATIDSNDGGQTFVVSVCMKNDESATATIPSGFNVAIVVYKIGPF